MRQLVGCRNPMDLKLFQAELGLQFSDELLLEQALTHRSYLNEQDGEGVGDNERLEFLGDSVLDFLITDLLYRKFPEMPEGEMTRLRAALVRTDTLAQVGRECRLGPVLRMGKGEEQSGGRDRRNILCDAFEALVGALYLDQGVAAVERFVMPRLFPLIEYILAEGLHRDARSMFQEWSQAQHNVTPVYRVASEEGPDHEKAFTVEVLVDETIAGRGTGPSKQTAAQAAARNALRIIEEQSLLPSS
ncbi:MAG: ribonuclease III [Anaerolineae bacterium]|nr:ribonuclease III [Anaerolineae bacterium]